jgi:hypothetical protein
MASQWFYEDGGASIGPVSTAELKQLAISGHITDTTLIWKEGMPDWIQARSARGLVFAANTPTPPPQPQLVALTRKAKSSQMVFIGSALVIAFALLVLVDPPFLKSESDSVANHPSMIILGIVEGILVLAFIGVLYLTPSIIAFMRKHQNRFAILAINLLAGWTGAGWVAALVWSLTEVRSTIHQHFHQRSGS